MTHILAFPFIRTTDTFILATVLKRFDKWCVPVCFSRDHSSLYDASHGRCVPWTRHPLDEASLERCLVYTQGTRGITQVSTSSCCVHHPPPLCGPGSGLIDPGRIVRGTYAPEKMRGDGKYSDASSWPPISFRMYFLLSSSLTIESSVIWMPSVLLEETERNYWFSFCELCVPQANILA